MNLEPLAGEILAQPVEAAARALLGQRLVRRYGDELLVGRIVETEAYGGGANSTSHAFRGARGRATPMAGAVGLAYVYLIYGVHICLNVVAHPAGEVGAVLIRALAPEAGAAMMARLRNGAAPKLLTSGPGRLAQALAITREWSGRTLLDPGGELWLAAGPAVPAAEVAVGPRVGVVGSEEDCARPWRFWVGDDPNVSRRR